LRNTGDAGRRKVLENEELEVPRRRIRVALGGIRELKRGDGGQIQWWKKSRLPAATRLCYHHLMTRERDVRPGSASMGGQEVLVPELDTPFFLISACTVERTGKGNPQNRRQGKKGERAFYLHWRSGTRNEGSTG